MLDWLLIVACALGHLGLWVWVLNVVHGVGLSEQRLGWINPLLALTFVGLTVAILVGIWGRAPGDWPAPILMYGGACLVLLCIMLPATTIVRWFRPTPADVTRETEHDHVDLAARYGREPLVGEGRLRWLLALPGNESFTLERHQYRIERTGLHPALDGLEVLHLSDLHLVPTLSRRFFEAMVEEACAGTEPDLVLFTGDLIDDPGLTPWVLPLLEGIPARLGKFAILGNHDHKFDVGPIEESVRSAGFDVIEGRWREAVVEPGPGSGVPPARIAIGGTSEPWGPPLRREAMPEADYHIVLSHTPDRFYRLAGWGVELVLAGHNHGGQIRLPGLGPILMPSVYSRRFDHGFFRRGATTMYVSRGLGGKHPIRWNCPPEVARLQLRQGAPEDDIPQIRDTRPADRELATGPA